MALTSVLDNTKQIRNLAQPVIAFGVALAILYYGRVLLITAVTAVILAFILEPFVSLLVSVKFPRPVATFVVCSFALVILWLAGVTAWRQISALVTEMPKYSARIAEIVQTARDRMDDLENATDKLISRPRRNVPAPAPAKPDRRSRRAQSAPTPPLVVAPGTIPEVRIHDDRNRITDYIYARIGEVSEYLLMASFVPFLVYFMLSWHDHIYRSFLYFFSGEHRLVAGRSLQGIADMVRAFVVGNFVLGVLLAIISTLAFWFIRLPYPMLAGPISGFLSLVPYIGLPLALVVPLVVALAGASPYATLILVFFIVAALHLTALNVLYPKVVGARVHLNPLVVTFALMFWGYIWSAAGLVLAIPLTAGIKAVCDNVSGLRPYGRFLSD